MIGLQCETRGSAPVSIIVDESMEGRPIVAARIGDGEFTTNTHELLNPAENLRFMANTVGASMVDGRYQGALVSKATLGTLGTTSIASAVNGCFASGRFEVSSPVTLDSTLPARQLELLHLLSQGRIVSSAAREMGINVAWAHTQRDRLFATFGVGSVLAAITVGHLAHVLPSPEARPVDTI